MRAQKEIRPDRNDVYAIYDSKKEIQNVDGVDTIVEVESKIQVTTLRMLEESLARNTQNLEQLKKEIALDKKKIALIKAL